VTVSQGATGPGLALTPGGDDGEGEGDGEDHGAPTVVVAAAPAPRGGTDGDPPWDGPATMQTVKARRPDDRAVPADVGTGRRLSAALARRELVADADEALVRGPEGSVVGGAASNLCFVAEDGLHTPERGPVAPGIVREIALEVAESAAVPVHGSAPSPGEVRDAREAFLTSSWWGVRPVGTVDGIEVGTGPVTELVRREFDRRVEDDHY
jgi:branched-chain amino acid aminotransferase